MRLRRWPRSTSHAGQRIRLDDGVDRVNGLPESIAFGDHGLHL